MNITEQDYTELSKQYSLIEHAGWMGMIGARHANEGNVTRAYNEISDAFSVIERTLMNAHRRSHDHVLPDVQPDTTGAADREQPADQDPAIV